MFYSRCPAEDDVEELANQYDTSLKGLLLYYVDVKLA